MADAPDTKSPTPQPDRSPGRRPPGPARAFVRAVAADLHHFSPWRVWTAARLAVGEALRLRVLAVILLGIVAVVLADLTTKRFDVVFDIAPSLIRITQLVIVIVGLIYAVFLSTYSLPRELTTRTIYALVTKPISRLEIILGKMLGLMILLAFVVFGLGLFCWGYIEWRGRGVRDLAAQRYAEWAAAEDPARRPTDLPPMALKTIADRGPLGAVTFRSPDEPLAIISARPPTVPLDPAVSWLSGYVTHRAHWGFENLPPDAVDAGRVRVVLNLRLPGDLPDNPRPPVRVRILTEHARAREPWEATIPLPTDGRIELPVPGKPNADAPPYAGQRIWVSICGNGSPPLGVADDTCTIVLPDGRSLVARSGLKLSTESQRGRYRIGGADSLGLLVARTRFRDVPPAQVAPAGAVLHVALAVPRLFNVPDDARAKAILINEDTGRRHEVTFRPQKRTHTLVPVPRDLFAGGTLAVYITSDIEIGVSNESLTLQLNTQPFVLNWLKNLLAMWLSFCVLGAIGLCFSTVAGWHVASLATAVMFLVANVWQIVIQNVQRYGVSLTGSRVFARDAFQKTALLLYRAAFGFLGTVLPDFDRMECGSQVARGQVVPWGAALLAFPDGAAWYAAAYVAAAAMLAYLMFLRREVAR